VGRPPDLGTAVAGRTAFGAVDVPLPLGLTTVAKTRQYRVALGPVLVEADRLVFLVRPATHRALLAAGHRGTTRTRIRLPGESIMAGPPAPEPETTHWWLIAPRHDPPELPDTAHILRAVDATATLLRLRTTRRP
jgi:hypothetical protein